MTFVNGRAGILIYVLNALAERDSDFSTSDAVDAGENGFIDVVLAHAAEHKIDVSMLNHWFADDSATKAQVNDLYARWTNAVEPPSYLLSNDVSGWLWLSSISVDAFLVGPYGDLPAPMG